MLAALSDERLVDRIRQGSELAFEVAFERYGRGILAFCRHMLGSTEDAEDVVQHTFAAAYPDLVDRGRHINLKPWLYTIARNRCLSVLRARREDLVESPEVPTAGLHEEVQRRAELRELLRDIGDLPEEQRAALLLAEVGDMPHSEIAAVLDCEVHRVKALVFRARSGLIDRRRARDVPCQEIREQLANLRGGALRRSELRHHLRSCQGCRAFREEVRRQRSMLALALPVSPSLGLKASVLGALGLGGGSTGGGVAAGGLTAAAAGPATSAMVAKLAVVGTLAGGGIVAGDALIQEQQPAGTHSSPAAVQRPQTGGSGTGAQAGSQGAPAGHRGSAASDDALPAGGTHGRKGRGRGGSHKHASTPAAGNEHAGPKPVPPNSHANPRGRPAPTKRPVRRRGAGVRHQGGNAKRPTETKAAQPRAVPPPPKKQSLVPSP
jgi:RNA polymerase sigma factor (sigma-70 family)